MMCSPNSSDALGPADCHGIRRKQSYGGLGPLLRAVDADIVCLQEVKLKELGAPERALALEEGWDSYFSLCRVRTNSTSHGRYSGVATFCRTSCRPRMAEEGVTGELAPASGGVGHTARVNEAFGSSRLQELDGEGRGVITLHGDLALFNLYVPSLGGGSSESEEAEEKARQREAFKLDFLRAVELRAAALLAAGMRVLLLGDFNIAPFAADRAKEGEAPQTGVSSRSRQWLQRLLLGRGGPDPAPPAPGVRHGVGHGAGQGTEQYADCFRLLHPSRQQAYTCFHVASGADLFNYGSRIDLALLAPPPRPHDTAAALPAVTEAEAEEAAEAAAEEAAMVAAAEAAEAAAAARAVMATSAAETAVATMAAAAAAVARQAGGEAGGEAEGEAGGGAAWPGAHGPGAGRYVPGAGRYVPGAVPPQRALPLELLSCEILEIELRTLTMTLTLTLTLTLTFTLTRCEILEIEGSDHLPLALWVRGVNLPAAPPPACPMSSVCRLGGQRTLLSSFTRSHPHTAAAHAAAAASRAAAANDGTDIGGRGSGGGNSGGSGGSGSSSGSSGSGSGGGSGSSCGGSGGGSSSGGGGARSDLRSFLVPTSRPEECASASRGCTGSSGLGGSGGLGGSSGSGGVITMADYGAETSGGAAAAGSKAGSKAWQQLFSRAEEQVPHCPGCNPARWMLQPCVSEAAILRMQVPLCPRHRERCHLRTVKKAGPNKGRQFYTCPRAEGPAEQLESNCGYFQWQSDRMTQLKRKAASEAKA